jgi:hypothetical protein
MLTEDGVKFIVPAMNIQKPVTDDMLAEANRELARYAGARDKFWKYTPTHGRLVIEVTLGDGPYTYEYWSFIFVGRVCAPTFWRMVRPSVRRLDAESFIFSDEEVELDAVELAIQERPA